MKPFDLSQIAYRSAVNPLNSPYRARGDGTGDDGPALQGAIDDAAARGGMVDLQGLPYRLLTPLDLRGRHVQIRGGLMSKAVLIAGAAMDAAIDARGAADEIISPFEISNIQIEGAGLANIGLAVRYRHNMLLSNLYAVRCATGLWEHDAWLARHVNCRTEINTIGCQLEGANHASTFTGCSFIGSSGTHLKINANGSAGDGNDALAFYNCDYEFPLNETAVGIDIALDCNVTLDTCYLGENFGGDIIRNRGSLSVNGGVMFPGFVPAPLPPGFVGGMAIRPLGGLATFSGVKLNGQSNQAINRLVGLADAENSAAHGAAVFEDCPGYMPIGGQPLFGGDVLGYGRGHPRYAATLGRLYTPALNAATLVGGAVEIVGNGGRITCETAPGPTPIIGMIAPLTSKGWRIGSQSVLVIVYRSNKAVQVQPVLAVMNAPSTTLTSLPSTGGLWVTAVKLDGVMPPLLNSEELQFAINPCAVGDFFELLECFWCDVAMAGIGGGVWRNLYKCG